ncbi:hypothetical protein EII31_01980 [Leucobacter sp. OH2974_COT-288]|uniref:Uncharacterized protein n=1 Tax=Canibacter oris TaxID=1365628 RepID=A0A840DDP6_9MICO|nr:Na+ dependent nucleoside transporter N-terminal domain-containing protein [Canibacter oris]MBB4071571.1 hypothetical protein [Canibacter oris]RRD36366.1 hypothetical protein EII31_01980 [Leucobacter sp. OH2974_COT-288]
MKKIAILLSGVALGFVLAHFVNATPAGRKFFEQLNQGAEEIRDAVIAGYNEAE